MKIYIASDHGGFNLKEFLLKALLEFGYDITDIGPKTLDPEDDFPDYVKPLCEQVVKNEANRGILLCRNGVGVSIDANKFDGIRCGLSFNETHVKSARNDDDINVVSLPSDYINETEALDICKAFLATAFGNKERYNRRINKIKEVEKLS